ncbi:MAG: ATP-binding protein [Patescibacteria group bacterium]
MLRKVKFNNFYSFKGVQEIDFLTSKKKSDDYYTSKTGEQITKIMGLAGPNASGKTNIMRLFSFLSYFICRETPESQANNLIILDYAYKTHFNNNKESNFFVEFEKNDKIFFYEFSLQNYFIKKEKLVIKDLRKKERNKTILERDQKKVTKKSEQYFASLPNDFFRNIRPDVSLITFLKRSQFEFEVISTIFDYFANFQTNINERGEINHLLLQIVAIRKYLNDPKLKEQMERFITNFDLGLAGFKILEENLENNQHKYAVSGIHKTKEKKKELDIFYESSGTRQLFFYLPSLLDGLNKNGVVIIDEMEVGLHPEALNQILNFFIDENKNRKAQLIFSSHSLNFLKKLNMQQIYLTEKDDLSISSAYRLDEVNNIRPDENFLGKYMSGAYGAFPKIRI